MSKSVYCIEKIDSNQTVKEAVLQNNDELKKATPAKRVNIVTIKMVKEGSILYKDRKISSPSDAVNLMRGFLENADREQLMICCLDTKNQPTSIHTISVGSLNSSIVHPREVFKVAILGNSASIILFHNHPSGDCSPSNEDINVTNRLKESGKILGVDLIDHIIIGMDEKYCSLKEKGVL